MMSCISYSLYNGRCLDEHPAIEILPRYKKKNKDCNRSGTLTNFKGNDSVIGEPERENKYIIVIICYLYQWKAVVTDWDVLISSSDYFFLIMIESREV